MELVNSTRMMAAYTMGLEPSGRELLVVVVKGTFQLPSAGDAVRLADEQLPLVMADTFTGEPGRSAPVYEADFAPRKQFCDVLLNGSAYAPRGRPTTRVDVGMSVNGNAKTFAVIGDRHWRFGLSGVSASSPEPFTVMPVSYDRAFGGVDTRDEDPSKHFAFTRNPVGRGFHKRLRAEWVDGAPLSNTEELNRPVETPSSESYVPMSLGAIGRSWEPRVRFTGTYDDNWLENDFPFLPPDFNELYFQAAPPDQQVSHPQGGEEIRLRNLTPEGTTAFILPVFDAPVHFFPKRGPREDGHLVLDTILFEPDHARFLMTWRATRPLKRNMLELSQVLVGRKSGAWWSARERIEFPIILHPVQRNGEQPSSDRAPGK